MTYYDELIENIDQYIEDKKYDEAKSLVIQELNMPYIPMNVEKKLKSFLQIINQSTYKLSSLSDEQIIEYLNDSEDKQLIAVTELDKRNLRNYIEICNDYLSNDGFINAKSLLIDSLIRQEINYEFNYVNDGSLLKFNPSKLKNIEETNGFKYATEMINDFYMKDPSKAEICKELLYKEALLSLPNEINGISVADKIVQYVEKAFSGK